MTPMRRCNYHPYIDSYMDRIRSGEIPACKELTQAMDLVENKLDNPDVVIRSDMISKADELIERYFYKFVDWELFALALIHCFYKSTDTVVFDEFLIMVGTGNGKNGFISAMSWYFTTHYHGIKGYNVEIVANSEDQAKRSFNDVYEVLEDTWSKSKKFFYKTKEVITNLRTRSSIRFNTSNARTRLGKRAGCVVFDEILEYEDWEVYNAFNASFGKIKHGRQFFITTNGYVRQGFLDDQLDKAEKVLTGEIDNVGFLPLIYKLDDEKEVHDKSKWVKANPSLYHFPELQKSLDVAYTNMQHQPQLAIDFLTKRMNLPRENSFTVVAPWEKILATNKPIPYDEIKGAKCIGALDFAQVTDFASVGLLFKHKGKRIWLEHSFVCRKALQIESRRIRFPVEEMAERGLITIVNGESITAEHIAQWFLKMAKTYHILNIVGDRYRIELLRDVFTKHGLPLESVASGPATHAKVAPLIESMFAEEKIIFGDNPTMRWYVNNTCIELNAKGNTTYLKIEPHLRKTDGFFALIHALAKDSELPESDGKILTLDIYVHR
jgi:phage terminase large subunit-like protein